MRTNTNVKEFLRDTNNNMKLCKETKYSHYGPREEFGVNRVFLSIYNCNLMNSISKNQTVKL